MWSFDGQLLGRFYEITLLINNFSSGKLIKIEGFRHGLPGGMWATASSRSAQEHPMEENNSERLAAPRDNSQQDSFAIGLPFDDSNMSNPLKSLSLEDSFGVTQRDERRDDRRFEIEFEEDQIMDLSGKDITTYFLKISHLYRYHDKDYYSLQYLI